ncbi:uncharacterized protein LOC125534753 [Triticum urartu]|uniref:uncharacterized protein LOC125534753 n=1 Tax=Triticum urartu TaxID=4572 RepID=UPI00204326BD|nr:uncharacterized protein LOC125534753 [Triticum urartu]
MDKSPSDPPGSNDPPNPSALTLFLPLDPPPPHTTPPSGSTAAAPNPHPSLWISTRRRPLTLSPPWAGGAALDPVQGTTTSWRRGRGAAPDQVCPLLPVPDRSLRLNLVVSKDLRSRLQDHVFALKEDSTLPPVASTSSGSLPSPPPLAAAALLALFQQWSLRCGPTVNPRHLCGTQDWIESFTQNASVGCSCDRWPVCRITHLNITGFWNLAEIPPELFNSTELVSLYKGNSLAQMRSQSNTKSQFHTPLLRGDMQGLKRI